MSHEASWATYAIHISVCHFFAQGPTTSVSVLHTLRKAADLTQQPLESILGEITKRYGSVELRFAMQPHEQNSVPMQARADYEEQKGGPIQKT